MLGKGSQETPHGKSKLRYRKNFEISLIVSIVAAIFFFRLTTSVDIQKYLNKKADVRFEMLDIPVVPPVVEEKPKLKMESVVQVEPEVKAEPEESETNKVIEEIEELLNEEQREQLVLDDNRMGYLVSDSPLDIGDSPGLNLRKSLASAEGGIQLASSDRRYVGDGGDLDIGTSRTSRRQVSGSETKLDLDIGKNETPKPPRKEKYEEAGPKLGLSGAQEKVLSFSSTTIDTEDYKLWNKIISELDRLNKGRHGGQIEEMQRSAGGFVINFSFHDRTKQEIHWRNDGNIWIKVIGSSRHTTGQELSRALNELIRISL